MRFEVLHPRLTGDDLDMKRRVLFQRLHHRCDRLLGIAPFRVELPAHPVVAAVEIVQVEPIAEAVENLFVVRFIVRRTIEAVDTYIRHRKTGLRSRRFRREQVTVECYATGRHNRRSLPDRAYRSRWRLSADTARSPCENPRSAS